MAGINIVFKQVAVAANAIKSGAGLWLRGVARALNGAARLVDFSNNSNDATLHTGRFIQFDGSTTDITNSDTITGIHACSVWVNPDTTTENLFDFDGGTTIVRIASGTVTTNNITSPTIFVDDAVSSTAAASTWQLITISSATAWSSTSFRFGSTALGGNACFIRLFSRPLTLEQVQEMYNYPERILPAGMPRTNLLTFLPLTEGSDVGGVLPDQSLYHRTFTFTGETWATSGPEPIPQTAVANSAKRMYNAYVNISDAAELDFDSSSNFSIVCRAFVRSTSGAQGIVAKGNLNSAYSLTIQSGSLSFRGAGATGALSHALSGNTMYTFAATVSGGTTAKLYVNAVEEDAGTITAASATADDLQLAGYNSTNLMSGVLYYAAIYDTTLNSLDIDDLHNGLLPGEVKGGRLVGYWTNDSTGTWTDRSRFNNPGTVTGSPSELFDIEGVRNLSAMGLPFNELRKNRLLLRSGGYALVSDDTTIDATTGLTIEAWVKISTDVGVQQILFKNGAYALRFENDNTVDFSIWQSSTQKTVSSTATLSENVWYHLCGTHDGADTVLYIDGEQEATTDTNSGNIDSNANDLFVGASSAEPANPFSGDINNVRVYTSAATALEVVRNYRKQKKLFSYE